jgi:Ser/Thr protein kinase RdoA (MazF antagonist)
MNIEGLSEKTIRSLHKELGISSIGQLYYLTDEDLAKLEGFKDKKINNLLDSLFNSKVVELPNYIFALGINGVGVKTAKDLAKKFKSFENFEKAVSENLVGRADSVKEEIAYLRSMAEYASYFENLAAEGKIQLRVTHNDTKCNNVMFDMSTGDPLAVIDLDTVMPGYAAYDFGDAVRFAANTGAEDEKDLSLVSFDTDMFSQFAAGFVPQLYGNLNDVEIKTLPMGALVVALELSSRFLADYLNGDTYFKIHRENHNLDRARTQFKLVADIEAKYDEMLQIVEDAKKSILGA